MTEALSSNLDQWSGVSEAVLVIFPGIKEETLCIEVEKMAVMLIYISKHSGNEMYILPPSS